MNPLSFNQHLVNSNFNLDSLEIGSSVTKEEEYKNTIEINNTHLNENIKKPLIDYLEKKKTPFGEYHFGILGIDLGKHITKEQLISMKKNLQISAGTAEKIKDVSDLITYMNGYGLIKKENITKLVNLLVHVIPATESSATAEKIKNYTFNKNIESNSQKFPSGISFSNSHNSTQQPSIIEINSTPLSENIKKPLIDYLEKKPYGEYHFGILGFELGKHLTEEQVIIMKKYLQIPAGTAEKIKDVSDLINHMYGYGLIKKENITKLVELLVRVIHH